MKLLRKVAAIFFDRSIDSLAVVAGVMLVFLWGVLTTEVILRALVNYSIHWIVEISEFCLMAVAFLGTAWLLKKEGHIKVDILFSRLKPRTQALVNIITSIMGVVCCLLLVWYAAVVSIEHFQFHAVTTETELKMVTWPRYAIISLGCLLLVIQFGRRVYGNLLLWRMAEGKEVASSEKETWDYKL